MAKPHAVHAAIHFVATEPGAAERILLRHYADVRGWCAGCFATPTRWPCSVASIARAAARTGDAGP